MLIAALVKGLSNRRRLQLGRIRRGRLPIPVRVGSRIATGKGGAEVDVLIWLCERPTALACSGWPSRRAHLQNRLQGDCGPSRGASTGKHSGRQSRGRT